MESGQPTAPGAGITRPLTIKHQRPGVGDAGTYGPFAGMEKLRDILDMADPYDAYAYFICCFICSDCQADLPPDEGFEGCDDICCRHIADKAKVMGWYVPSPEGPERRMTLDRCYCAECARKRGLKA